MTRRPTPDTLDLTPQELTACLARVQRMVEPADFAILEALLGAYLFVHRALSAARVSVARLKRLFFGAQKSEKSKDILGKPPGSDGTGNPAAGGDDDTKKTTGKKGRKPKGHGRLGASDYPGATRIPVHDKRFSKGCPCLDEHCTGKLYLMRDPGTVLRIIGQAVLIAKIWEPDHWRCSLCGETFHAQLPVEAQGNDKYEPSAVAMIALLHCGNGFPYHRLAKFQKDLGIPVPASDQSELLKAARTKLLPVFNELRRLAAQVDLLHNDDTGNRILALQKKPDASREGASGKARERTGIHTTSIVAITNTYKIALYATGRKHAGENLSELLELRDAELPAPKHMSDGLDHNRPAKGIQTVEGKCLTHGRRQFVDIASSFPDESRRVIETLREVYRVDALAKETQLPPADRLLLHQEKSGPVMDNLRRWLVDQFLEKDVEPNSSLGRAIKYMLKRWDALTLFLHEPGAPLDNNISERVLKLAIRHRRNSLFFKTTGGAAVGDLFTSLIATCQLNGVNPFDYLTALLTHTKELAADPAAWLPWNYPQQTRAAEIQTPVAAEQALANQTAAMPAVQGVRGAQPIVHSAPT
jgi:hypothetical protein